MNSVKIALIQNTSFDSRTEAWDNLDVKIKEAAISGAKIICTQELFDTPYFCRTQDTKFFDLAIELPGMMAEHYSKIAKDNDCVLILSTFEKRASGIYHNTALIIDADGQFLGKYRKMHIPQDPCFEEKFYFTPGDTGFRSWKTKYGNIGVIICWDQWYPEAARLTALNGADIIFCPTAIGWLSDEKSVLGEKQKKSWLNVQKGHAVANACYYAAVNRVGVEGEIEFWGNSFVSDFYGEILSQASTYKEEILYVDCDFSLLEAHRQIWPFYRDRRIDAYNGIMARFYE